MKQIVQIVLIVSLLLLWSASAQVLADKEDTAGNEPILRFELVHVGAEDQSPLEVVNLARRLPDLDVLQSTPHAPALLDSLSLDDIAPLRLTPSIMLPSIGELMQEIEEE